MKLRLENVRLSLSSFVLELDFELTKNITGIFGPSGAGKTSLLDLIVGLRRPQSGRLELDNQVLLDASAGLHVPSRFRRIGYVPQDLALFPHLNVEANLAFGRPKQPIAQLSVEHVAEVMEVTSLLPRAVHTLSGGEQQRVAFARAILSAPRLLLLDEPMSNLDLRLKKRLLPFLLRIREEFRIPLIYVTHDFDELIALCDEVLSLEAGRLVGRGTPADILQGSDRDLPPHLSSSKPTNA